jgi:MFS family permease
LSVNLSPNLLARRLGLLVATFWVGSLWAIGYVVAPTLFATLADRVLAGTIAGSLFLVEAWLSLICGVILALLVARVSVPQQAPAARKRVLQLIAAMMLCTLVGYFGLQPFMAAIRESSAAAGGLSGDAKLHFGILHGAASAIYLLQSLVGGWLICRLT